MRELVISGWAVLLRMVLESFSAPVPSFWFFYFFFIMIFRSPCTLFLVGFLGKSSCRSWSGHSLNRLEVPMVSTICSELISFLIWLLGNIVLVSVVSFLVVPTTSGSICVRVHLCSVFWSFHTFFLVLKGKGAFVLLHDTIFSLEVGWMFYFHRRLPWFLATFMALGLALLLLSCPPPPDFLWAGRSLHRLHDLAWWSLGLNASSHNNLPFIFLERVSLLMWQ